MSNNVLDPQIISGIKEICRSFGCAKDQLISVLHKVQHTYGYLPHDVQKVVAEELKISQAKVYGVVTFYSFFTMKPRGKFPIAICTGTACYVRGAEKVLGQFKRQLNIEVGETTADGKFSINCLRCVGACGLAPVVMVGEKVFGRVKEEDVVNIIAEYNV